MKQRLQILKKTDSSATVSEDAGFQLRPLANKTQQQRNQPLSQTEIENQEFQQHQFEATKLELQAKHGSITPDGQTRLTLLQAKMNELLHRQVEIGADFGHNIEETTLHNPERTPSSTCPSPVQAKLTIGKPGDKDEQEADQVAATVVNQIHHTTIQKQQTSEATTSQDQVNVNNLGKWLAKDMSAIINQIQKLLSRGGNNDSDLESLMREVQNNSTSAITSKHLNQ